MIAATMLRTMIHSNRESFALSTIATALLLSFPGPGLAQGPAVAAAPQRAPAATPGAAAVEPTTKDRVEAPEAEAANASWRFRLRLGAARFALNQWVDGLPDEPAAHFAQAAVLGEVAVGTELSPDFALQLTLAGAIAAPTDGENALGQRLEGDTAIALLFGPTLSWFVAETPLELDLTLGGAYAAQHRTWSAPGDPTDSVGSDLHSFGLGYALSASYQFEIAGTRLGPYVQWRASKVGDILADHENYSYWTTTSLGGGFQFWL